MPLLGPLEDLTEPVQPVLELLQCRVLLEPRQRGKLQLSEPIIARIHRRRIASLGGRFRDVLASFLMSSVLRSRILASSATTATTSPAIAPFAIMSAMNFFTASRSGAIALVIGGGFLLGSDTRHSLCLMRVFMESEFDRPQRR
jgi:hypothetical protein